MGRFFRDMKGRVSFVYDEKWRNAADAYPISLSMPLTLGEHGNSKNRPVSMGIAAGQRKGPRSMGQEISGFVPQRLRPYCGRR
jgi:HipA-like protein